MFRKFSPDLYPSLPASLCQQARHPTGCIWYTIRQCRSPAEAILHIPTSSPAPSAGTYRGDRLMSWAAPPALPARHATTPSSTSPSAGCAARLCVAVTSASASGSASGTALATDAFCAGAGGSPRARGSRSCFCTMTTVTAATMGRKDGIFGTSSTSEPRRSWTSRSARTASSRSSWVRSTARQSCKRHCGGRTRSTEG